MSRWGPRLNCGRNWGHRGIGASGHRGYELLQVLPRMNTPPDRGAAAGHGVATAAVIRAPIPSWSSRASPSGRRARCSSACRAIAASALGADERQGWADGGERVARRAPNVANETKRLGPAQAVSRSALSLSLPSLDRRYPLRTEKRGRRRGEQCLLPGRDDGRLLEVFVAVCGRRGGGRRKGGVREAEKVQPGPQQAARCSTVCFRGRGNKRTFRASSSPAKHRPRPRIAPPRR